MLRQIRKLHVDFMVFVFEQVHAAAQSPQIQILAFISQQGQGRAQPFHSLVFRGGNSAANAEVESPSAAVVFAFFRNGRKSR